MGTRSLTYLYEEGSKKPFVCMYRQFDGYPSGHGSELAKFLAPIKMRNGYQMDDKVGTHANGMGCLAAQLVAHLKTDIGGIYLHSPDTDDAGQEYEYHIYSNRVVVRDCYGDKGNALFSGSWKNFALWCATPDDDDAPIDPADAYETVGEALQERVVRIQFEKADGTKRTMRATLNMDLIPEDKHPIGTGTDQRKINNPSLKSVFDLDKNDWRSYRTNRLLDWHVE